MNTARKILLLGLLAFLFYSCLPVLVGGLIYKSSKSEGEKREFLADFNRNNTEREKSGLPPLNKCREIYQFDPGWAYELADCRAMVDSLNQAEKTRKEEGGKKEEGSNFGR